MNNTLKILILVLLIFTISCGGSSSSDSDGSEFLLDTTVKTTEFFGNEGNIYKPRADTNSPGPGNLVVLLSAKFTKQFDSCEVRTNTGETAQLICINDQPWTQTPFSCFSNGNRQTWRANFRCNEMGEVKVTCRLPDQEVIFTVPEEQRGQICNRFG